MKEFKGKVCISGKEYTCEVINGVRYIDGVETSEFMKRLSIKDILQLSNIGAAAVDAEIEGVDFSPINMYETNNN